MRWIADLFQTWRAGLALLGVFAVLYGASFIVAAAAIYALESVGAIDQVQDNRLYWGTAFVILPYFLASTSSVIRDCLREMQLPPSAMHRQLEKIKKAGDKQS